MTRWLVGRRKWWAPLGVVLSATASLFGCTGGSNDDDGGPPNVILISADTLRADRLGAYGYDARPTSPEIDARTGEAVLFQVHVAAAPWTTPSHLSLLTGLTPTGHGVTGGDRSLREALGGERPIERLGARVATLGEVLQGRGFATAAFTGGATLDPRIGFDQGFDTYDTSMVKLDAEKVERVLRWIDENDEGPFFLFWHTFEIHAPYLDPRFLPDVLPEARARALGDRLSRIPERNGWKSVRAAKRVMKRHEAYDASVTSALYDGGVRSFDEWLALFLDGLEERGLLDETLLVLTSDHGEQLGEAGRPAPFGDGFYNVHGHTLFEELVRVPLIMRLPGGERGGHRVPEVTASIDVMPTILDVVGAPVPADVQGRSLRPLWEGQEGWVERAALSESLSEDDEMKSLRGARYKSILTVDGESVAARGRSHLPADAPQELYDLKEDPAELHDLLASGPPEVTERAEALGRETRERLQKVGEADEALLSPEAREGLEALGYVQ